MPITYAWRGDFDDASVNALHAQAFRQQQTAEGWRARLDRHSLGWVCAHRAERLVGFVNVAWDGGAHAFVLDTMVADDARRSGIGTALLTVAADGARAAGCDWLHVDFEGHLHRFYREACGFRPTEAGLMALR